MEHENKRPSDEELGKRENRPCFCVTAVFPKDNGNNFPSQEIVKMLCELMQKMASSLGFTQGNMCVGPLGKVNTTMADTMALLMDEEAFEAAEHKENHAEEHNKEKEAQLKKSSISIEDVMKGLKL